jgi:hypothetical protein
MTALGIGLLILGLSILLTPTEPMPRRTVRALLEGSTLGLEALLEEVDAQHKAYYVQHDDGRVYTHVPLVSDKGPMPPGLQAGRLIAEWQGEPYLIVLPPGSELVRLGELPEGLEAALSEVLVDQTELCESVTTVHRGDCIVLEVRGARGLIGAGRFIRVMGSLEASVAACVAAAILKRPVRVALERDEVRVRTIVLEVLE